MNFPTKWLLLILILPDVSLLAQQSSTADHYFSREKKDEYRWLEDMDAENTLEWINEQSKITRKYLRKIRNRDRLALKIRKLSYANFDLPHKEGNHYYSLAYEDRNNAPTLFQQNSLQDAPKAFISSSDVSFSDEISIVNWKESRDGQFLAFAFSRNGSNWHEIKVKKMKGGFLEDHLTDIWSKLIAWGNDGFFYLKHLPGKDPEKYGQPGLMYHRLGTDQENDKLLYRTPGTVSSRLSFNLTVEGDYLIVKDIRDEYQNIFLKDLNSPENHLRPLITRFADDLDILAHQGDQFIGVGSHENEEMLLVSFDRDQPTNWTALTPSYEDATLTNVSVVNSKIIGTYQMGLTPRVVIYNLDGKVLHAMDFSAGYHVGGFFGNTGDEEDVYYYTSYFIPPVVQKINLNDFTTELIEKTQVAFDIQDYEMTTVTYPSKDGTEVPMTIVYKKGLIKDGKNPTLIKTYGGYGTVHQPYFDGGLLYFLEEGGVFAYCHVRGEGTLGYEWARAGRNLNKQNAIDDFIAGAEYLIEQGYTNPKKLAITGASHGGLMVGAAMTQRPGLFEVAVPVVGVFDMLRFEKFSSGSAKTNLMEFGSVKNEAEFNNLLSYSPLHNIEPGVNYPATLIMTSDNDERVPSFHSYKFAAKLQDNPGQKNPVLLRVEEQAGHFGAHTLENKIYEKADMYSFILYHLIEEE